MRFEELLDILGDRPVFASSLLRVGDVDPVDVGSQLSRWTSSGRLLKLRRGVYAVAEPYRTRDPHPFEVANALVSPSYVSLESALALYGLIPEAVFATTSVTTARAAAYDTPLGRYTYRHVAEGMFWGYTEVAFGPAAALVARAEKALLDLVYLRPRGDTSAFLRQLRLERLQTLDVELLDEYAARSGKPKLRRAAERLAEMAAREAS